MKSAALVASAAAITACSLFTPKNVATALVDVGCVIANFSEPDPALAKRCGFDAAQAPAAREQAVKAAAAAAEHPEIARLARPDGGTP